MPRTYTRKTLAERFWPKVIVRDGCWGWRGATHKHGYGRLHSGTDDGVIEAHRASWMIHKGAILKGRDILHTCDNPPCTNPEHLFQGTHLDNMRDKMRKGRANIAHGERHGHAKLTEDNVREIRARYGAGETCTNLAAEFGVSQPNVNVLVHGKTWKHVT